VDEVVPYDGSFFSQAIPEVVDFWVNYNNCNTVPTETEIEDSAADDASTATHFVYSDCDNNITTELFRITGGDHSWPDAIIGGLGTNRDINGSQEVWKFFKRFTLSNGALSNTQDPLPTPKTSIYPNPASGSLEIDSPIAQSFKLLSPLGHVVQSGNLIKGRQNLKLSQLGPGTYFFKTDGQVEKLFIVE